MYIPLYLWGWWDGGQRKNEEVIWGYIKKIKEEGILNLWELKHRRRRAKELGKNKHWMQRLRKKKKVRKSREPRKCLGCK